MNTPLAGTIHNAVPEDFAHILLGNDAAYAAWQAITPLARNEWLCWIESAKRADTRTRRIARAEEELALGEQRPCCWIGCIHRTDKEVSLSVRGILGLK